jgi:hypothetical protein
LTGGCIVGWHAGGGGVHWRDASPGRVAGSLCRRLTTRRSGRLHDRTGATMKRVLVIAASGLTLAACAGTTTSSLLPKMDAAGSVALRFESSPAGAEVQVPDGRTCTTPCSLSVPASEMSVTFSLPDFMPETVPIQVATAAASMDPFALPPEPRLAPNPVFVDLRPAGAPPRRPVKRKPVVAQSRPAPVSRPAPAAMAPPPPAPAPASASPWPPPPPPR